MKLTDLFNLTSMAPLRGAESGIWLSILPQEVATAIAAGSGAGVPDTTGTPVAGTVQPGHIVEINSSGYAALASSPDLDAAMPKMLFVVFSGDEDLSGSLVGECLCFHGGARFETTKFTAGAYTPGQALIANTGVVEGKALADDGFQCIGVVGPNGLSNGVLDVIVCQGSLGR